ncbi:MAG: ATP-binding cassette domain-containing protein [Actinomycetota bacterium]|nr:ATP-binding cassette domain-containing protein [Actinomycetota bacterium]MCL6092573.1 ATP-binding cassette domain-containing protein [Actinomycetota bacterium]MDA8166865.1 ATP-binding cassette domain-containing protein [Actinomycetota bacterium]
MAIELSLEKNVTGFRLDVEWSAETGLVALFGFSGSGKTMTLRQIAGLERPDRGYVRLDGDTLFDSDAGVDVKTGRRQLGYVFQNQSLFPHMTIRRNIAFGLTTGDRHTRADRLRQIISLFRLEGLERAMPAEISGGQQQRVALARALIGRPRMLLLDEPLSALDLPDRLRMREIIKEAQAQFSIPVILVTHSFREVEELADMVFIYSGGRVAQAGPPAAIRDNPAGPEVCELLGPGGNEAALNKAGRKAAGDATFP